jgi:hypothetical protein
VAENADNTPEHDAELQAAAQAEQTSALPYDPEGTDFFFRLIVDEQGVQELAFRKNADNVIRTLLNVSAYINGTFDNPFPTVGDFLRQLGTIADEVEALNHADPEEIH